MLRNIKLIIEYDGTSYSGWQSQNNAVAIQDIVKDAVRKLTNEKITLIGASRTDAGVHAYGQVANFSTLSKIPSEKFSYALNSLLPQDIVVRKSEEVRDDFHSRFSSTGKKYRYLFYSDKHPSAILRDRAYHVYFPLEVEIMDKAAQCFVGTYDFSAFKAAGSSVPTSIRTINHTAVKRNGQLIEFEIQGNGFLYNMVRIIAGTLVEVGTGRMKAEDIPEIIASGDRRKAGRTAPAHGLYLVEVYY